MHSTYYAVLDLATVGYLDKAATPCAAALAIKLRWTNASRRSRELMVLGNPFFGNVTQSKPLREFHLHSSDGQQPVRREQLGIGPHQQKRLLSNARKLILFLTTSTPVGNHLNSGKRVWFQGAARGPAGAEDTRDVGTTTPGQQR
jgi:hypothetical protein